MKRIIGALALFLLAAGANAQVAPQVQSIGPNDLFQDIVGGAPMVGNVYASQTLIGNIASTQSGAFYGNALVGGDFGQNLFQRGTSVSFSASATAAYSADRWANWSGTNTPLTLTQQTGATDIVAGTTASFRVNKGSNTGTAAACIAQEVESQNSIPFAGQTAEFSFYGKAGPTFSAALSNVNVYITYGTGTDDGIQKLAYSVNAGGSGSTPWAGGVNAANGVSVVLSSSGFNRYAVAAAIPATATEIGVAICYTPVGTGSATDWYEIALAQLTINPALTSTVATGGTLYANDNRTRAFVRRPTAIETALQQRYFWNLTEPANGYGVAMGVLSTTTNCMVALQLPVTMRAVPTFGSTGTLSTSTWKIQDSTTSTLASTFLGAGAGSTANILNINATLTTASTAGWACQLQGAGGTSSITATAEL